MSLVITSPEIERYAEEHSTPVDRLLEELIDETQRNFQYAQMIVGPLEGATLRLLARLARARRILEIGTFTGYSSLCMAEALPEDGELITLDNDPDSTALARKYFERSAHGKKVRIELGDAIATLERIRGAFQLVFIDADKSNYVRYWETCVPMVESGGILAADNVLWSGRVLAPREESDRAIAAFNEHVRRDRRVETVMLPIRDGMTVARKK